MGEDVQPGITPPRPRGRPRGFNKDQALDAAMRAFWSDGYCAASIDRLCRETGMSRASLYQDFGGKEGLFLAVIAHYVETQIAPIDAALGPHGTLEQDLVAFFASVIDLATRDNRISGCLVSCVLADVAGASDTFQQELSHRFAALESRIAERLRHDPCHDHEAEREALAGMIAAVARGIMLRARSGASAGMLTEIASVATRSVVVGRQ